MKPPYYDSDLIQTLQLSGEYIGRSDQPETTRRLGSILNRRD